MSRHAGHIIYFIVQDEHNGLSKTLHFPQFQSILTWRRTALLGSFAENTLHGSSVPTTTK